MNKIKHSLYFIRNNSIDKLFLTIGRTIWYNTQVKLFKLRDCLCDSNRFYVEARQRLNPIRIEGNRLDYSGIDKDVEIKLWERYSHHQFDLLGSGWINSSFEQNSEGFEGYIYSNQLIKTDSKGNFLKQVMRPIDFPNAQKIFSHIKGEYEPIDWQKDFKSGYRWGANQWYRPIKMPQKPGVDIKVPWELSRLQHLPRLALLSQIIPEQKEVIYEEFCNQLLDFIAQNPVRMGVNHMCTMDVGIRVANIALACSLWKGIGQEFEKDFEEIVTNYLFNECEFIRKNLEWSYYLTLNHYFADIAGLLWGSAVLPKCHQRDKWLHFSRQQLLNEIIKQFYKEGSNGEGSTAYHRLTGEMAVYSVALIHYLSRQGEMQDAPQEIYDLLFKAGCFLNDITRPDGLFTQIGDNDSGLFFKLSVTGGIKADGNLDENPNDGRTFVSAIYGMFADEALGNAGKKYPLEKSFIRVLCGNDVMIYATKKENEVQKYDSKQLQYEKKYYIGSEGKPLLNNINRIDYPEFGIYIFRSDEMYLCVNLSDNGQEGRAGHAHNDKLSFELFIGEKCIFEDPGVYVYTALPDMRDCFRSTQYHNTIYCGKEQNRYNGIFSMYNDTRCFIIKLENNEIEARVEYREFIHERKIIIQNDCIQIIDKCNHEFVQQFVQQQVSRGYGKLLDIC